MNTTNLFVELIVSGVGAAIWVCLLVLLLFDVDRSALVALSAMPVLAIPALAVVYLLGILTDRLSDVLTYLLHGLRTDVLSLTRSDLAWTAMLLAGLALACWISWKNWSTRNRSASVIFPGSKATAEHVAAAGGAVR